MLKYILSISLIFIILCSHASPRVPANYEFAGIKLTISDGARKQIQADVDALHRNQTYLNRKIEKVDLYFPIIERVFREENLPDDFKYLTIQESALVSDAVSSSNAVGFWQFKEASATEVGLRVDRYIDERMHITASSRGAAKYLKKNNFFFDNWIYALLAYNTGPGGAERYIDKKYLGKKKMDITKKTHWYVKKFLAHKIAFENEIHKNYTPSLQLYEYSKTKDKSLKELSDYFEIDHQTVADYNKWLKRNKIPSDKMYLAIIPVRSSDLVAQNLLNPQAGNSNVAAAKSKMVFQSSYKPISEFNFNENQDFPKIKNSTSAKIKINGIFGFIASPGNDLNSIVSEYDIPKNKFLKYNDMTSSDRIDEGKVYYLKAKKSKAKIHYHIVLPGENAWSISQKYGIKLKKLLTKNRMKEEKDLSPGMVMWLRFIRPADVPVEYKKTGAQNVIVKSVPNEMEYPQSTRSSTFENNKNNVLETAIAEQETAVENEFLFEEINEDTDFINENSYVDLKKEAEKTKQENVAINTLDAEEEKNIKKRDFYHIVKSGETLFSISRTYQVSIGELRQWNEIEDLDQLNIGQRLLIKKAIITKDTDQNSIPTNQYKTYIVKQDDTLYGIARKHDISIKDLMDLNDKDDFTIKQGETLKIKVH